MYKQNGTAENNCKKNTLHNEKSYEIDNFYHKFMKYYTNLLF